MSTGTDGQGRFVGREDELRLFENMLNNPRGEPRVLFIRGDGGIGKTKLLEQMLALAKGRAGVLVGGLIDAYSTEHRHIDGIQRTIIDRLGEQHFESYLQPRGDTSENFRECLSRLCEKVTVVLAFDTFEQVNPYVAGRWILQDYPHSLQMPGLICVIGSRTSPLWTDEYIHVIELGGFSARDAWSLYKLVAGVSTTGLDPTFQEFFGKLLEMTKGHPLKLELAFTWWQQGLWSREALEKLTADQFDERLMARVREFGEQGLLAVGDLNVSLPVYQTIICMAYLDRRFNRRILQYLINRGYVRLEDRRAPSAREQEGILAALQRFFFVKVRRDTGDIQLHDELTGLVKEYLWPQWGGLDNSARDAFKAMALELYDTLINEASEDERDALWAEKLCYTLRCDLQAGNQLFFDLAERLSEDLNKLLAGEMTPYIDRYPLADRYEISMRLGQIEADLQHHAQATSHYQNALAVADTLGDEQWIHAQLALHNVTWQRSPKRSLDDHLWPALKRSQERFTHEVPATQYEIGFAYRRMQNIDAAINWYEKAKESFKQHGGSKKRLGIILNDLGYVYTFVGEYRKAEIGVSQALKVRHQELAEVQQQLEELQGQIVAASPEEKATLLAKENRLQVRRREAATLLGTSYNTLGEIARFQSDLDTAIYYYTQALEIFKEQEDPTWQAKALFSRAEAHRRIALHKLELHDPGGCEWHWNHADADLEESLYLCERFYIMEERSTAHRRRGRSLHDRALWFFRDKGDVARAKLALDAAREQLKKGLHFARQTDNVLEEFENLTELAFLADDLVTIAGAHPATVYDDYITPLSEALEAHRRDEARLYQFDVFENLLRIELGAYYYAANNIEESLRYYLEGYSGLAADPGYGMARYRMHYNHLIDRIQSIQDKATAEKWCNAFIDKWQTTKVARPGIDLYLAQVHPDLVEWCEIHMLTRGL